MRQLPRLVVICAAFSLSVACTAISGARNDREATADALEQLIIETATASVADEPSAQEVLETAQAAATEAVATIEASGTEAAADFATARAIPSPTIPVLTPPNTSNLPNEASPELAGILTELPQYGIDPATGSFGGIHLPESVQIEGFQQYGITQGFGETPMRNFVMAADVTWNTVYGAAGCGFILRSSSLEIEGSSQYLLIAVRDDGGNVFFQTRLGDELPSNELFEFDVEKIDPAFQWLNNRTNRLAVVAQNNAFTIFSNGTMLGTATPPTFLPEGLVTFVAVNDSGSTSCTFTNGWLWLLN
jgi:hypothetical protein